MNPLNSIWGTLISGLVLSFVIAAITSLAGPSSMDAVTIWTHVAAGITWIGLLYYFNFVQVPGLAAAAADEGGPGGAGISKYIAPRALLWFRWAALLTWLSGAFYLMIKSNLIGAFTLGMMPGKGDAVYQLVIGVGAWLGTIMLFNVWVLIWPNQKKILGLDGKTHDAGTIASAKKIALLASRTNTALSVPMLLCMVGYGHGLHF